MNKSNKIAEFLKKITDEQYSLRRLPVYFFLICILLVVLIFKIGETNQKLEIIAEKAGAYIDYETKSNNDSLEIFSEKQKGIDDVIPQFESETSSDNTESDLSESSVASEPNNDFQNVTSTASHTKSTSKETATTNTPVTSNQTTRTETPVKNADSSQTTTYVINKSSKKIHRSDCSSVARMKDSNKLIVSLTDAEYTEYLNNGYSSCKVCGG